MANSHSPTNSAKNCRKISPANNNSNDLAILAQKIDIPQPHEDNVDTKSNNSARKLTISSEAQSEFFNSTISANSDNESRKQSVATAFGPLINTADMGQRQFQKFSLVDNYTTPYVKLTPRSARSLDVTLRSTKLETSDGDEVDTHNTFINLKKTPNIVPNADTLHSKKKSGVNVAVRLKLNIYIKLV
jgi:hypothetical protein